MIRALAIVAVLATTASADGVTVSARVGPAHLADDDGTLDAPPSGWGIAGGLAIGYAIGRVTPMLAFDAAQYRGTEHDYILHDFNFQHRLFGVSAKVAIETVHDVDVTVGLGLGEDQDGLGSTSHGSRVELGAGYRVWHDDRSAIRVEASYVRWTLTGSGETSSHHIEQLGASVGYAFSF